MKKVNYILSFIIPLLFLILIFYLKNFITGENSLLISDLWGQYYLFLTKLKDIMESTGNIFYSFNLGFGQSFLGTFAYYLASPFNIILLFFDNVQQAVLWLSIIKISLCGLTMFTLLKYHFKNKNSLLLAFSTAYALSLFMIGNYFQLMWLDGFLLAPLVLLGIDKFIDKNKAVLYIVTLFLTVLTNYYVGYMVCIFSVIYFIYRLILKYKWNERKKLLPIIIKFAIISALAGLLTMFLHYPNLLDIFKIDRQGNGYWTQYSGILNFNILENTERFFIGNYAVNVPANFKYGFYYCGMMVIPLLYFYFVNKDISKKEKICSLIVYLILFLTVFINPLNNFWHALQEPLGFNYRYLFLFVIFTLYLCCKSFIKLSKNHFIHYFIVIILFCILGIIASIFTNVSIMSVYLSAGLVFLYLLIFYLITTRKEKKQLTILFVILVLAEIYFNAHFIFFSSSFPYNLEVMGRQKERKEMLEIIYNYDDSKFYRMEFESNLYNDALLYDYNSASLWTSTIDTEKVIFFKKVGYVYGNNIYKYHQSTILDSLFNVKYYTTKEKIHMYKEIAKVPISESSGFLFGKFMSETYIYENPFALSLGYMVDDDSKRPLDCENISDCQQFILSSMVPDVEKIYIEEQVTKVDETTFKFKITRNSDFDISFELNEELTKEKYQYEIYLNNMKLDNKNESSINTVTITNDLKIGEEITIKVKTNDVEISDMKVNYINFEAFADYYNALNKNKLEVEIFEDGYVKGNINVTDKNTLFTSIPYEKGWKALVDGKEVTISKMFDTFVGIDLEEGNHQVEFIYNTPGLKTGIIISSVALLGTIGYLIYERRFNKKKYNNIEVEKNKNQTK